MNRFHIFIIRAILGSVFAVVIGRFFFPDTNLMYIAGLAVFLVGLAYVSEFFHNRKSKPQDP